jgi:hypothetical protein
LIVLAALSVIGLGVYRFLAVRSTSGASPVISFESDVLEVTTDATDGELLQGVTAEDAEDGDVTDSLLVETSTHFVSDKTVEVTYAAFDSQGHVTKANRSVRYVDYTPPHFRLSGPLVFSEAGVSELLAYVGAHDCIDGDISSRVKISSLETGTLLSTPGLHYLEFRVTNSTGDTAYLKTTVEVVSGYNSARQIPLTDYLVYLPVGSTFDPKAYLTGEYADDRDLTITNEVNTEVPGVYDVHYTLGNSMTRLIVVVEEG